MNATTAIVGAVCLLLIHVARRKRLYKNKAGSSQTQSILPITKACAGIWVHDLDNVCNKSISTLLGLLPGEILHTKVSLDGRVLKKRKVGASLYFLEVKSREDSFQIVIQRQNLIDDWNTAKELVHMIGKGDVLLCQGFPGRTRTGNPYEISIFITAIEILEIGPKPERLLKLLSLYRSRRVKMSPELISKLIPRGNEFVKTLESLLAPRINRALQNIHEAGKVRPPETSDVSGAPQGTVKVSTVLANRRRGLIVVIENPSSPGNVGAILRTCDGFGVSTVCIVSQSHSHDDHKAVSVSRAASAWLRIKAFSTSRDCFAYLQTFEGGFQCVGTAIHSPLAQNLMDADLTQTNVALWFGNEQKGLSEFALSHISYHVWIPTRGVVESLNVSVAAGIVCWEIIRQRRAAACDHVISSQECDLLLQDIGKR